MAEDDLPTADSLISAAEALNVKYNVLHLGDTPKRARNDLQRRRKAAVSSPTRPSQLFSQFSSKKPQLPKADPFAGRLENPVPSVLGDTKGLAQSHLLKGRKDLAAGNLLGAGHWYRMAARQQATFGPAEDSPEKLAADIRKAGGRVDEPTQ